MIKIMNASNTKERNSYRLPAEQLTMITEQVTSQRKMEIRIVMRGKCDKSGGDSSCGGFEPVSLHYMWCNAS